MKPEEGRRKQWILRRFFLIGDYRRHGVLKRDQTWEETNTVEVRGARALGSPVFVKRCAFLAPQTC
jgi:hypothetical protein